MSKAQLAKAAKEDDGEPCNCKQCEKQRAEELERQKKPVGSSRRPKKDQFSTKYGPGKTLGGQDQAK
jgi:hypothetical protein